VIVNLPASISNKKFSSIGTTGLVVITPLIFWSSLSSADDVTMNFIFSEKYICEFIS
jgi:hypothetical protein